MLEARCIECGETETGMIPVQLDDPGDALVHVCPTCVSLSSGPGRFEGVSRDMLPAVVAAYAAIVNGFSDSTVYVGDGDVDGSAVDLVGRFIIINDAQGFLSLTEYPSVAEARAAFAALEEAAYAEEDDDGFRLSEPGTLTCGSRLGEPGTLPCQPEMS